MDDMKPTSRSMSEMPAVSGIDEVEDGESEHHEVKEGSEWVRYNKPPPANP